MIKQTLFRFSVLLAISLAVAFFVLRPFSSFGENLWFDLMLAFFCYSFSWIKSGMKWMGAFLAKYGCMAILFRSLPAIILLLVFAFVGFSVLCTVGVLAGLARFLYQVGVSIFLDCSSRTSQGEDDSLDLW